MKTREKGTVEREGELSLQFESSNCLRDMQMEMLSKKNNKNLAFNPRRDGRAEYTTLGVGTQDTFDWEGQCFLYDNSLSLPIMSVLIS